MYPDDTVPDPTLVDFVTFAESGPVTRGRAVRGRGRTPRRGRGRGRAVERVLCPSCGRGFQRNKVPPNWVNCVRCGDTYHDRHTHDGAIGGQSDWICVKCDTEDVAQTPEDQVPDQFPPTPALVTSKIKIFSAPGPVQLNSFYSFLFIFFVKLRSILFVCNQIQRPGPGPGSKKAKELDIEVNRNLSIF